MYVILSENKDYLHGCFPFSEQGKIDALKYQKKIKKNKKIDTYIIEK